MTTLDNVEKIKELDKSDMAGYILELPKQIESSLKKIKELNLPESLKDVHNLCLGGMGGSAIANYLAINLPMSEKKIPMKVIREYNIPAWVNENSLVVLTSHSGKTQETLSALESAVKKQAKVFIIAERGQLEEMGKKAGAIVFDYDTKAVPRASLGYQLGAVFGLLTRLKIIGQPQELRIKPAIDLIKKINSDFEPKVKSDNNVAKNLAYCCLDYLPVIVGSGILQSVAWRWKTQINENANQTAFTEILPEAMHNAIQGTDFPKRFQDDLIYIILKNSFDSPKLILQFKKFENVLESKKIRYEIIEPLGDDIFSQKLSALILGDWVSYYLAMLNNVDPTPVETIEKNKQI